MCFHAATISDLATGDIICTACSFVIEKYYDTPVTTSFTEPDHKWKNYILNVCANMCVNDCIATESLTRFRSLISTTIAKQREIAAYALYETLLKHNVGKTVEEVSFYTEVLPKAIWKVEKSVHCEYDEKVENYLDKFCYFNDLTRRDAAQIRKLIVNNVQLLEAVEGRHPQNVATALIILYCEKNNISKTMKSICDTCGTSVSSAQQMLKKLKTVCI
jgi:transcription initiation factor TFIIIB Brf1 subunit/transcription initiation factor TFIIB